MDIVAALLTVAVVAASSSNGDNNDNGDGDGNGNGDDNTTITGTVSAGKYISGSTNDSVKAYKADGTGTTSAAGIAYPSGAPEFTHRFKSGSCYSIFRFICRFCRSLFVLL
jgi:hypothetical protein